MESRKVELEVENKVFMSVWRVETEAMHITGKDSVRMSKFFTLYGMMTLAYKNAL